MTDRKAHQEQRDAEAARMVAELKAHGAQIRQTKEGLTVIAAREQDDSYDMDGPYL